MRKKILLLSLVMVMVMSNLLTVNATESSSKTKSIMTEAIYDLKKGGIQNFQIRSKNDEIVYVTIEELTRTSRIANGTYQVTYTVPLAWKAGFKARISSNKFTKVYDPYYTVIAGAIRQPSLTLDSSIQARYRFVYQSGALMYGTGVKAVMSGTSLKVSQI